MNDEQRGLYRKYIIDRADGSSGPGGKHESCDYFVLDLTHDKYAFAALMAYASECAEEYPALASDLRRRAVGEKVDELARERLAGSVSDTRVLSDTAIDASVGRTNCGTCRRPFPASTEVAICKCDGTFVTERGVVSSEAESPCESCERDPRSKWCRNCLIADYEAAHGITSEVIAQLAGVAPKSLDEAMIRLGDVLQLDTTDAAMIRSVVQQAYVAGRAAERPCSNEPIADASPSWGGKELYPKAYIREGLKKVEIVTPVDHGGVMVVVQTWSRARAEQLLPVIQGGVVLDKAVAAPKDKAVAAPKDKAVAAPKGRRCHACDQVREDVGAWPDSMPLCAQCTKAHTMGYRCGEDAARDPKAWPSMPAWSCENHEDTGLAEDKRIDEAFPTRSERHDLYAEAMRFVGARRTKAGLVALVNWLLHRIDEEKTFGRHATNRISELTDQLAANAKRADYPDADRVGLLLVEAAMYLDRYMPDLAGGRAVLTSKMRDAAVGKWDEGEWSGTRTDSPPSES